MGKKFSIGDKINVVAVVIALFFGVVSTVIALYAIKSSEKIAEKSRAYDQPALVLALEGLQLQEREYDVTVGPTYRKPDLTLLTFPFEVSNRGKRSIEDLNVLFRYHELHRMMVDDSFIKMQTALEGVTRKTYRIEPFHFSVFRMEKINPAVLLHLDEPIAINATEISDQVEVKTKDNQKLIVPYSLKYGMAFNVTATAKDLPAVDYRFNIAGSKNSTIGELVQEVIQQIEANNEGPKEEGFWDRLFKSKEVELKKSHLVMGLKDSKVFQVKAGTLHVAKADPDQVRLIRYSPDVPFALIYAPDKPVVVQKLTFRKRQNTAPAAAP